MRARKKRAREDREHELLVRHPNMTRALPPASVYSSGYPQYGPPGSTAPWSQPANHMFFNDDIDEPASPTQYPSFQQTSAVFQRR
ncbi:hypothetical protein NP493_241g04016 [Ridgeia piscesae]|uniref:Uncharacterized protein n=1 Tax=Ridgeia piscesae TaxID=27915 RepID=A0AAD9NZC3_RIDPI|nr:hypothetical protein NP493_241g04016 [Ridgeia piscesae]